MMNTQHAEGEMNEMQRRAALAVREQPQPGDVVKVLVTFDASGKRLYRGQTISRETFNEMRNRAALLENRYVQYAPPTEAA
jgi:hypothetical protein